MTPRFHFLAALLLLVTAVQAQELQALTTRYAEAGAGQRPAIVLQIARLKTEQSRAWLHEQLSTTRDEALRASMVGAIGRDGHESNGAILLKVLAEKPSQRIALASLNALGRIDGNWHEQLVRIARISSNAALKHTAVNALARKKDDQSFALLDRMVRGEDLVLRGAALSALGRTWPAEHLEATFARVLQEGEPQLVQQVIGLLLRARSPEALPVIRERVGVTQLRSYAGTWITGLAIYDTIEALELMVALAAKGLPRDLGTLARALHDMKAPEVLDWLRNKGLKADTEGIASAARRRLLATGAPEDEAMALRMARGEDDDLAVEAIDALAGFPGRKVRRFLEKMVTHRDVARASAALVSLWGQSEMAEDVQKDVIGIASRSRSWQLRMIATELLRQRAVAHEKALVKRMTDRHPLVREVAYDALSFIRERRIIALLIDRLSEEKSVRAERALVDALEDLSGRTFGKRERLWREWWVERHDNFDVPPKPKRSREKPGSQRSGGYARYYGLEVNSKRIAFVIDVSGSMGARTGKSKLRTAKDALIAVLERFEKTTRFNVVAFHSTVHPWQDRLVPASKTSRAEAREWINALRATGGTNVYDSLVLAMDLEDVDTIFLLSDGGPSAGTYTDMDEILRRITRMNRLRRIRINTIGIGLGGAARTFMEQLAEQNFGESVTR